MKNPFDNPVYRLDLRSRVREKRLWILAVFFVLVPLALSLLRKGGLDVPVMLLMNALVGVNGIVWATPIADFGAMLISCVLLLAWRGRLKDAG